MENVQVGIVGASLAGSSLALRLAQNGLSVALFDKGSFPRRKPCGEGLSCLGQSYLRELGLEPEVLASDHALYTGYRIWNGERVTTIDFSNGDESLGQGMGIQRYVLDNLIVCAIEKYPSVKFITSSAIRDCVKQRSGYLLRSEKGEYLCEYLVLADGLNSMLASKVGLPVVHRGKNRFGFSMMLEGRYDRPLHHVHIFPSGDSEVMCTPVSANRLNLSILGSKGSLPERGETGFMNGRYLEMLKKVSFQGEPIDNGSGGGPLRRVMRRSYGDRLLLVGDCCETLDPIGGMGMTHALMSSAFAARSLTDILHGKKSERAAFEDYEAERTKHVRLLRGFTRLTYLSLKTIHATPVFTALHRAGIVRAVGKAGHGHAANRSLSKTFVELVGRF